MDAKRRAAMRQLERMYARLRDARLAARDESKSAWLAEDRDVATQEADDAWTAQTAIGWFLDTWQANPDAADRELRTYCGIIAPTEDCTWPSCIMFRATACPQLARFMQFHDGDKVASWADPITAEAGE